MTDPRDTRTRPAAGGVHAHRHRCRWAVDRSTRRFYPAGTHRAPRPRPESGTPARTGHHRGNLVFAVYAYSTAVAAVSTVAYVWHAVS